MTSTHQRLDAGTRVRGTYYGNPITGTISSRRGHTINYRVWMTHIELDEPTYLANLGRTETKGVLVHTDYDGSVLPSEAGDWGTDYLTVIP